MGELDEVAGHIDHAVVFVHHDHAARAHDRAERGERLVVDRRIEQLRRDAAARGATGLNGLHLACRGAAADVVNDVLSGVPSGISTRPVLDLTDQREDLRSRALGGAGLGKPGGAAGDDGAMLYQVSTLLMLVGLPSKALFAPGTAAADVRPARLAFDRSDQRRLFAADECARAFDQLDLERESGP